MGNVAQDRQALSNDYSQQQQAREKLQADWKQIQADIDSGNAAQFVQHMQQFQQDRQLLRQDRSQTGAERQQLTKDRRQLDRDEWQDILMGNAETHKVSAEVPSD